MQLEDTLDLKVNVSTANLGGFLDTLKRQETHIRKGTDAYRDRRLAAVPVSAAAQRSAAHRQPRDALPASGRRRLLDGARALR